MPSLPRCATGGSSEPEPAEPPSPSSLNDIKPVAILLDPAERRLDLPPPPDPAASLAERRYWGALEHYDRQLIAAALAQSGGDTDAACHLLGISRNQLRTKMQRYFTGK
jgi:DNA-binding NtrC family response regulator